MNFLFYFKKLVARAEMIATQEEGIQERHGAQPQQQISPAQLAMALSQAGVTTSGRHESKNISFSHIFEP